MATLSTFSSWKGRSALLKGAGLIHNVWYFLFTISSNLHYSNKNYAFLPHLWQKIIGNSKGEGSLKPVISNQLGSAWKTTFPKLMVPILCNFYMTPWNFQITLLIKKLLYLFLLTSFPLVFLFTFITGSICPSHRIIAKPIKTLQLNYPII